MTGVNRRRPRITVTFPDPATNAPTYLIVAALIVALALARRVPLLGALVSLGGYLALAALLVLLIDQHAAFNPQFERMASVLRPERQRVEGEETRLRMAADGHFWAQATIDGRPRRLLVDSGATVTALSEDTARAVGLQPGDELIPVLLRTANGTVRAQRATVNMLQLGNVVARDLPVVVTSGAGGIDVLGMNFLSRLKSWRVEDGTLILTPHNPQPEAASSEDAPASANGG